MFPKQRGSAIRNLLKRDILCSMCSFSEDRPCLQGYGFPVRRKLMHVSVRGLHPCRGVFQRVSHYTRLGAETMSFSDDVSFIQILWWFLKTLDEQTRVEGEYFPHPMWPDQSSVAFRDWARDLAPPRALALGVCVCMCWVGEKCRVEALLDLSMY